MRDVAIHLTILDEDNNVIIDEKSEFLRLPFSDAWWEDYAPQAHRSSRNCFFMAQYTTKRWKKYTLELEITKGAKAPRFVRLVLTGGGWK